MLTPPPDVVAHCANEKTASHRGQSVVFGNFAGGRVVSIGSKLSDLVPKSNKRISTQPTGGAVIADSGVSECLVNKSATSIGAPEIPGVRRYSAGVTITLRDESTGAESNLRAVSAACAAKGFRSMPQSNKFGGWGSFPPSMGSLEEASARCAQLYPGRKGKVSIGKWEEAELSPDWHVEAGGCPRADRPHAPPPAPRISVDFANGAPGISGLPRGFANRSGPGSGIIPNTRRFAIATANALFAIEGILGSLRRHSSAHWGSPSSGADVADCYACAMTGACEVVYSTGRVPIRPEEHSLWSGRPWAMPYPEFGQTPEEASPPGAQQSAHEYLEYVSCLLSRAESFLPVGNGPLPEGSCTTCGSTYGPMSFPLCCAMVPLSSEMGGDLAIREFAERVFVEATTLDWAQGHARCLAGLYSGAICTEPIPNGSASGNCEARAGSADVIAFCVSRNAERRKCAASLPSAPSCGTPGFYGISSPMPNT